MSEEWSVYHGSYAIACDEEGNIDIQYHDGECPLCQCEMEWVMFVGRQHKKAFGNDVWVAGCPCCHTDFIDPKGDGAFCFLEDQHMKTICNVCNGRGEVFVLYDSSTGRGSYWRPCSECHGRGYIEE